MKNKSLLPLVETAIVSGIAFVLSLIPLQTANATFDISLAALVIMMFSIRRGMKYGMMTGAMYGVLAIITGKAFFMSVPQVLIEYPVAFLFMGISGLFRGKIIEKMTQHKDASLWIIISCISATFARYIWHFLAGFLFWGSFAPKGQSPILYSFLTNGISFLINTIFVTIILILFIPMAKKVFLVNK